MRSIINYSICFKLCKIIFSRILTKSQFRKKMIFDFFFFFSFFLSCISISFVLFLLSNRSYLFVCILIAVLRKLLIFKKNLIFYKILKEISLNVLLWSTTVYSLLKISFLMFIFPLQNSKRQNNSNTFLSSKIYANRLLFVNYFYLKFILMGIYNFQF